MNSVDILELNSNFEVIAQTNFSGAFIDGDSVTYSSVVNAGKIPTLLQLNIVGANSQNEPIVNFYAIAFTNNCLVYPVIEVGNSAGWTSFVSCGYFI